MTPAIRLAGLCLACTCAVGCVEDRVYPGFYGEPRSEAKAVTAAPPKAGQVSAPTRAGSGSEVSRAGSAAPALTGGTTPMATGGMAAVSAGAGGSDPGEPVDDACDLSGRWLVTLHYVTDALGQLQTVHSFIYYELERRDDAFAIVKSLHCGDEALAEGLFAFSADFRSTYAAVASKISYAGRPVSSTKVAGGCDVKFGKWYIVRGATYPHYTDPAIRMPTADQPANGTTPGWEDWDGDGKPGITGLVSGTVTGKIFVAPRLWSEISGTVSDIGDGFVVPLKWDQEPNLLSYDGTPLLDSESVRAADPSLHFAELARLQPNQAVGDDPAICSAVLELAKTLTPRAAAL